MGEKKSFKKSVFDHCQAALCGLRLPLVLKTLGEGDQRGDQFPNCAATSSVFIFENELAIEDSLPSSPLAADGATTCVAGSPICCCCDGDTDHGCICRSCAHC